jgi:hypothetical protein
MPRCPSCREHFRPDRDRAGARCPHCREPLYEEPGAAERAEGQDSRCALHGGNAAVGTCQRCGNFTCRTCRTRWQQRSLCAECVGRALEAGEAAPEEARGHARQAVIGLVLGTAAWGLTVAGIVVLVLGMAEGLKIELVVLGVLVALAGVPCSLAGLGQAAAAVRTRGNFLIPATAGLLLCGLHAGLIVAWLGFSLWNR